MGLITELGYEVKKPNAIQRQLQRFAASPPGSWLFQRTLYPLDKLLFRLSKGRWTFPQLLAGLPVIMITTTGAKTGRPRTMPLLGVPMGDDMAIIGSNYGQEATPGWVYNLRKTPEATVAYGPRSVDVSARLADEAENDRAFEAGAGFYGGFPKYRERAAHRAIEVFILTPRADSTA